MNTFGGDLVQINFREVSREISRIGSCQRKKIFDDPRQTFALVVDDCQRLLIFGGRACVFANCNLGFAPDDSQRRPQLVRGIRHKPPLLFKRFVQSIKQIIENRREITEFVVFVGNRQTLV